MKMSLSKYLSIFLSFALLFLSSCSEDESTPTEKTELEKITKVKLTLNDGSGTIIEKDLSIGANSDPLELKAGVTYSASVAFFQNDIDVTADVVIADKDNYFITYNSLAANASIDRSSDDTENTNNYKIGIKTDWNFNIPTRQGPNPMSIVMYYKPTDVDDSSSSSPVIISGTASGGTSISASLTITILSR